MYWARHNKENDNHEANNDGVINYVAGGNDD